MAELTLWINDDEMFVTKPATEEHNQTKKKKTNQQTKEQDNKGSDSGRFHYVNP